jgi:hypothetical protein
MKITILRRHRLFIALAMFLALAGQTSLIRAQGTAFTYQGRLNANGITASGLYDFRFRLAQDPLGNNYLGEPYLTNGLPVTNGLFTTTIDFGPGTFTGSNYWLEVDVRTNSPGGTIDYTALYPLSVVTPTPYAIFANSASNLLGAIPLGQLPGTVVTQNENVTLGGVTTLGAVTIGGGLILPMPAVINTDDGNSLLYADDMENFFAGQSAGNLTTVNMGAYYNTAAGADALTANTSGVENIAVGTYALNANTTGNYNTALGVQAMRSNTNGSDNTAIGNLALAANTSGYENTAVGDGAMAANTNAVEDTALGASALYANTSGSYNVAVGYTALTFNTSGYQNTAVGNGALFYNTNGDYNTAVGYTAMQDNASGNENVAEGYGALFNNVSGSDNTASGGNALFANISGNNNEAYGYGSLGSLTNGSDNSAYGSESLYTLKNGNANVAVGDSSLESIPSGNDNTAVGYYAFLGLTNGSSNIALGYDAGFYLHQGSGDIYIGNDAATTNSETNIIRIGEAQTKTYLVGTVYANTVALTSDRNAKENFTAINVSDILAKIAALPVTRWNYKTDSHAEQHIGPMAQDFQAAFQLSADDKHISVVDEGGVALAAIQGLNRKLDQKDAEIQALKQQNDSLATRLASLEQTVQALAANPKTANAEP